jgi:DedD protein
MNDILKRRLIGLAALLVVAFLLSLLLPHGGPESGEKGVPSVTLPLSANTAGDATAPPAPSAAPPPTVAAASAPAPAPALVPSNPAPAPDASAPAPGAPATTPAQSSSGDAHGPVKLTIADAMIQMPPAQQPKPAAPAPKPAPKPAPATKLAQATPPSAAAAPAPAAPTPAGKTWYVQIGSFSDQNHALTTLSLLQNIGYHGESTQISNASGANFYRVRLGPFGDEVSAQQAFDKVSRQGYPQARVFSEGTAK